MNKYTYAKQRINHKGLLSRDVLTENQYFESMAGESGRKLAEDSVPHLKTSSSKAKRRDISTHTL